MKIFLVTIFGLFMLDGYGASVEITTEKSLGIEGAIVLVLAFSIEMNTGFKKNG